MVLVVVVDVESGWEYLEKDQHPDEKWHTVIETKKPYITARMCVKAALITADTSVFDTASIHLLHFQ